jgi:hypothetical protein
MVGAQRTRTNKNNSSRVTLVKLNGDAYPRVVPPNVGLILQQRNERERFLALELKQISNEIPKSKECETEWVSEVKLECFTPLSQSLFKEHEHEMVGKGQATTATSRLKS